MMESPTNTARRLGPSQSRVGFFGLAVTGQDPSPRPETGQCDRGPRRPLVAGSCGTSGGARRADRGNSGAVSFAGHFWTLGTNLRHRLRPWSAPAGEPWSTSLIDPKVGEVRLTGELHRTGSRDL